jgi:SAM-dependent methyltransferase
MTAANLEQRPIDEQFHNSQFATTLGMDSNVGEPSLGSGCHCGSVANASPHCGDVASNGSPQPTTGFPMTSIQDPTASSGQTSSGQTSSGQTSSGQTSSGQTSSGQTSSGQTSSGQSGTSSAKAATTSSDAHQPDTTKQQDEVAAIYRERFGHNLSYRRGVWNVLVEDLFRKRAGNPETVLEIGTGYGDFINQFEAKHRLAMDLNPDAAKFLDPSVTFFCQDATQAWKLDNASVDLIFTSNFFEHLPDKDAISQVMKEALRVLKPGGRMMALGPNIKHVPGAYWDFWDHTIPLTDKSLAEAFKLGGFTVREAFSRTLPYTMSNVREAPLFLLRAYLRMPFAWRILGHQFLVVVEKPVA